MKKFEFTLEKLKGYREQVLKKEKNALGILRSEHATLSHELEELLILLAAKTSELNALMESGTTPAEISTRKRFISQKQQEIHAKRFMILQKEQEIEKQLGVVVEATKELSTLEKLEQAQLDEYKAQESKENELFIDEFVTNADWRKGKEE